MSEESRIRKPELWGGIECTINRVQDEFFDQLAYSRHYDRDDDIELFADLNIKRIRYPILWEKHEPVAYSKIDWTGTEERLQRLRDRDVDVIAGLVHHGSGPSYTSLSDDQFPNLLAQYAKKVAEKFPWINYYTPINEPLTTARFSGLYGLWYPHKSSGKHFAKMLLIELKAVVLAMKEIRTVNPNAKLLQTEDLGKVYSTKKLRYQARFENERRWLTYDILCGALTKEHKLWKYFRRLGIPEEDLLFFVENPCVPDILGFNYYVTSERYLDENLDNYPKPTHGGNGRHQYADVEAARVEVGEETGIELLLREAWERYRKPMAITEVHLHCHREEQLRWFKYVWNACLKSSEQGINIKGVTAWALLGSYGWNKLLTKPRGLYEPGVFDLRGGSPRPTALARFIKELNTPQNNEHPLSSEDGWWQRSSRLIFQRTVQTTTHSFPSSNTPIVILGKNGTLGRAFSRICYERYIPHVLLGREDCDITDEFAINRVIETYKPWAIINAAGYVRVDDAESEQEKCFNENAFGPERIARACFHHKIKFLNFSTDLVFDGVNSKPYVESDQFNPLNIYGNSKAKSEQLIQAVNPSALIIRTAAFFGPWDEYNFLHYVIDNLSKQNLISVANDVYVSPTYVPDLANTSLDLLIDDEAGIWHLANKGATSWADLAYDTASRWKLDSMFINAIPSNEIGFAARRPGYSVLGSEKGILLPSLDNALHRFFSERRISVAKKSIV